MNATVVDSGPALIHFLHPLELLFYLVLLSIPEKVLKWAEMVLDDLDGSMNAEMASESTSIVDSIDREILEILDISYAWPALPGISTRDQDIPWQRYAMPLELYDVPEDLHIPETLQQILAWSLIRGNDWAVRPTARNEENIDIEQVSTTDDSDSIPGEIANLSQEALGPIPATNLPSTEPFNRLESYSQHSRSSLAQSDSSSIRSKTASKALPWKTKVFSKFAAKKHISGTKVVKQAPPLPLPPPPPITAECTSCFEELPESELTQLVACRHYYCKLCMTTMIATAMTSEASFPPRCCLSPVPLHTILLNLNAEQRDEYKLRSAEYSLPPHERVYCPEASCSLWIMPSMLKADSESRYTCPHCSHKMCRVCRGPAHLNNTECPQDFGLEQTLEVAQIEGWQRCYSCQALVEHTSGCRHMTCTCRAEFCYVCGVRWQTCHCTEEDAQQRRIDIQQRREERAAIADAEAAEVARAIAEVQEMERREAEARRIEEERIAREEEEMLAALERQRLEEEAARQAAAEQAEREWLTAICMSFQDDLRLTKELLQDIVERQRTSMNSRHEADQSSTVSAHHTRQLEYSARFDNISRDVKQKYRKLRETLASKQADELTAMEARHEEEEDDIFLKIQIRLRGKPNREARAEKMMEETRKQQEEQREELQQQQDKAKKLLKLKEDIDRKGLRRAQAYGLEGIQHQNEQEVQKLSGLVSADQRWFEIVTQRRVAMLTCHRDIAIEAIAGKVEPSGMQDWQAAACEPVLPNEESDVSLSSDAEADNDPSSGRPSRHMEQSAALVDEQMNVSRDNNSLQGLELSVPGYLPTGSVDTRPTISIQPPRDAPPPPPAPIQFVRRLSSSSATSDLSARGAPLTPQATRASIASRSSMASSGPDTDRSHGSVRAASPALMAETVSVSDERKISISTTASSINLYKDWSNASSTKKSKWSFGRKSKELTPEEIRARLSQTNGCAF